MFPKSIFLMTISSICFFFTAPPHPFLTFLCSTLCLFAWHISSYILSTTLVLAGFWLDSCFPSHLVVLTGSLCCYTVDWLPYLYHISVKKLIRKFSFLNLFHMLSVSVRILNNRCHFKFSISSPESILVMYNFMHDNMTSSCKVSSGKWSTIANSIILVFFFFFFTSLGFFFYFQKD